MDKQSYEDSIVLISALPEKWCNLIKKTLHEFPIIY